MTSTVTLTSGFLPLIPGLTHGDAIIGTFAVTTKIRHEQEKAAGIDFSLLPRGQSGSGKAVFEELIHSQPSWLSEPLVKVNCPAIHGTLIGSELFCKEKGAFIRAFGAKAGRFEPAHRGTLFLDEIGELHPFRQAKGSTAP